MVFHKDAISFNMITDRFYQIGLYFLLYYCYITGIE